MFSQQQCSLILQVIVSHVSYALRDSGKDNNDNEATASSAFQEMLKIDLVLSPSERSQPESCSLMASTSLIGPHQHSNIATAVCALLRLRSSGWRLTDTDILVGIQRARLPARFQVGT